MLKTFTRLYLVNLFLIKIFFLLPEYARIRLKLKGVANCWSQGFFRVYLNRNDAISHRYAHNGFKDFEPATQEAIYKVLGGMGHSKDISVLNVGANTGVWPYLISKKFPNLTFDFTLIEANYETFASLRKNCYLSGIDFFGINKACSSKNGFVKFNSTNINNAYHRIDPMFGHEIEAITVDSLNLQKLHLVIIDVEGHEVDVVLGMLKTIQHQRPQIIIELSPETIPVVSEIMSRFAYSQPVWLGRNKRFSSGEKNFLYGF